MIGCERYYYEMSRYFPQFFFYRVAVRSIQMTGSLVAIDRSRSCTSTYSCTAVVVCMEGAGEAVREMGVSCLELQIDLTS
eukprot:COSAG01_NODE_2367_length_7815_cov_35.065319_3_plen_80_part_00